MTGDLKKLQGTWTIVALETDGNKMSAAGSKIVLNGRRFTTISMGGDYGGTVELGAKKKPKTFDLLFTSGPHQDEKSLGIYELDGDTWKICLAPAGVKTRPKEFATTPGSGFALEILKRGDVAAPAEPTIEPGTASSPATEPTTEMEGEWEMVSGSIDGVPLEPNLAKYGRRITHGDQLTVRFGPQVFVKTRFILEPIEIARANRLCRPSGGKPTQLGIYAFHAGALMVSMAPKGHPRPIDFTATKANRWTVTVWKPARND